MLITTRKQNAIFLKSMFFESSFSDGKLKNNFDLTNTVVLLIETIHMDDDFTNTSSNLKYTYFCC